MCMAGERWAGSRVSLCACWSGVAPPDAAVDDLDVIPAVIGEDDVESLLPASPVALSGDGVTAADGECAAGVVAADEGPARLRAGRERVFARRIAVKALQVAVATEADRRTLAGLLGCAADPVTLTSEMMAAPRGAATRAITDLEEVAAADPMEAPIRVATLARERQRALWSLLVSLGAAPGSPQQNEFKQALATAKAVFAVDAATRRRLAGVVELARRS